MFFFFVIRQRREITNVLNTHPRAFLFSQRGKCKMNDAVTAAAATTTTTTSTNHNVLWNVDCG